jgi:hypothetical protein
MIKRVAIVGSRNYPDEAAVRRYVDALPEGTVVITGGARGVDTWAEQSARLRGLEVVVHLADWNKHGRAAGMIRNTTIVNDADRGVAFWDGQSRGTMDTVRKMRRAGKPIEVIEP